MIPWEHPAGVDCTFCSGLGQDKRVRGLRVQPRISIQDSIQEQMVQTDRGQKLKPVLSPQAPQWQPGEWQCQAGWWKALQRERHRAQEGEKAEAVSPGGALTTSARGEKLLPVVV